MRSASRVTIRRPQPLHRRRYTIKNLAQQIRSARRWQQQHRLFYVRRQIRYTLGKMYERRAVEEFDKYISNEERPIPRARFDAEVVTWLIQS